MAKSDSSRNNGARGRGASKTKEKVRLGDGMGVTGEVKMMPAGTRLSMDEVKEN